MKRLFRSRLPPPLTNEQIDYLKGESHLTADEIQEWYQRFTHCYTNGYLTLEEFIQYLQQFQTTNQRDKFARKKSIVKKLFRLLDLNDDKHMNFDEFFLFNILMNQGSNDDKLRLIFRLYDRRKEKYLTQKQLEDVLTKMFEILIIPKPPNGLSSSIDEILRRTQIDRETNRISWNTFSSYVLEDQSLFRLLLPRSESIQRNSSYIITTRF